MKMISYATGSDYKVIGKPSLAFYEEALKLLDVKSFEKVEMISDDAVGDLVGIKELGAKTTLVLSGKCKSEKEALHVRNSLDAIVPNIGCLNG
jgi:NagD protein